MATDQLPVQLTLVDVSADHATSTDIGPLLNDALDVGGGCQLAVSSDTSNDNNCCDQAEIRQQVSNTVARFVKSEDRYLALGSLLLKSRAYHQTLRERNDPEKIKNDDKSKPFPVMELPRTEYRKPYIPIDGEHKSRHHVMSVSHQFPYVGLARLPSVLQSATKSISFEDHTKVPLHVGLDIVTYQPPNPRLYSDTAEFLSTFKDSFTSSEWGHVVDSSAGWFGRKRKSDEDAIREFYLRWAAKEAYTKAIGVGLGLEFGSFEIRFDCCEDDGCGLVESFDAACGNDGDDGRIGRSRGKEGGASLRQLCTIGEIVLNDGKDKECWQFTFLNLERLPSKTASRNENKILAGTKDGCACVCFGPLSNQDSDELVHNEKEEVTVEWTELRTLIRWHKRGPAAAADHI